MTLRIMDHALHLVAGAQQRGKVRVGRDTACRPPAIHLVTAMPTAWRPANRAATHVAQFPAGAFRPCRSHRILHHIFQLADVAAINILIGSLQQTRFEDKRGESFFLAVRKRSKISAPPLFHGGCGAGDPAG